MLLLGLVRGGCVGWGVRVRGRRCGVSFLLVSLVGGGGDEGGEGRGGRRRNEEREKKKEEKRKKKMMKKRRMAQITVRKYRSLLQKNQMVYPIVMYE